MTGWIMLIVLVTVNANGVAALNFGPFESREACQAAEKLVGLYDTHWAAPDIHTVCVAQGGKR